MGNGSCPTFICCFSCVSFKLKIRAASSCVKLYPDFGDSDLPGDGPAVQDEQSTHLELWAETFLRSHVASELLMPLGSQGVCAQHMIRHFEFAKM